MKIMDYMSPIKIITQQMNTKMEGEVLKAVQKVGVYVDKDELIKALKYDRDQYRRGYLAGSMDSKWIPSDKCVPEVNSDGLSDYILISFSNATMADIGRYEEDETGGAFYPGDEEKSYIEYGMFVNAWMPLPKVYKGDTEETR